MTPLIAANLWEMMHGGSTHLPIALMLVSAVSDGLGCLIKTDQVRDRFYVAGFIMLIAGTLGVFPAVLSGLMLARWEIGGDGALFWHHVFLWPAFGLLIGLSVWRIIVRRQAFPDWSLYLSAVCVSGCSAG
jgi:uncharacterized membrane protein